MDVGRAQKFSAAAQTQLLEDSGVHQSSRNKLARFFDLGYSQQHENVKNDSQLGRLVGARCSPFLLFWYKLSIFGMRVIVCRYIIADEKLQLQMAQRLAFDLPDLNGAIDHYFIVVTLYSNENRAA